MMLAKVKYVKVPSIPTSAACRRTQTDEVIDGCKQLEVSVFGGRSPMK